VRVLTARLSEEEIEKIYDNFDTPTHVKAHCRTVAKVGMTLAEELNKKGHSLDLALIKGASLTHDAARIHKDHHILGFDLLKNMGYHDEAHIVMAHMTYDNYNKVDEIDECDIVCIADRMVKEDKYVGLDERIDYILKKLEDRPDIVELIIESKKKTRALLNQIEKVIGKTIDELFA
jgi:HD superfamily phosphodiesterase